MCLYINNGSREIIYMIVIIFIRHCEDTKKSNMILVLKSL